MSNPAEVPVVRDSDGMWWHPSFPWDDIPEETDASPYVESWGYERRFVGLEHDADLKIVGRYFSSNDPDCSYWTPSKPYGEGWFLGAIYDSVDGPYALWMRPLSEPRP